MGARPPTESEVQFGPVCLTPTRVQAQSCRLPSGLAVGPAEPLGVLCPHLRDQRVRPHPSGGVPLGDSTPSLRAAPSPREPFLPRFSPAACSGSLSSRSAPSRVGNYVRQTGCRRICFLPLCASQRTETLYFSSASSSRAARGARGTSAAACPACSQTALFPPMPL